MLICHHEGRIATVYLKKCSDMIKNAHHRLASPIKLAIVDISFPLKKVLEEFP